MSTIAGVVLWGALAIVAVTTVLFVTLMWSQYRSLRAFKREADNVVRGIREAAPYTETHDDPDKGQVPCSD